MNTKQEGSVSMGGVVLETLLATYPLITASLPEANNYVNMIVNKRREISDNVEIQTSSRTGYRVQKDKYKGFMVDSGMEVANRGKAFAQNTNNPVLLAKFTFTRNELLRQKDTVCPVICKGIFDLATEYSTELVPYGVTSGMLTDLQEKTDTYNAYIPKPRVNITVKKVATANIARLVGECELAFEQIDTLVNMTQNTHPEFFTTYFNNRNIIDTGARVQAIRGHTTDINNLPLGKVTVIIEQDEVIIKKKKTTAKGNFIVKSLASGVYTITFSKPGYKNLKIEIAITTGECTICRVILEPND